MQSNAELPLLRTDTDQGYDGTQDEHEIQTAANTGSSVLEATLNLSNTIIGAGLMSLPFCFRVLGLAGGLILLLLTALITDISLRFLIRSSDAVALYEYDSLAQQLLGNRLGKNVVHACILLNNYGPLLALLLLICNHQHDTCTSRCSLCELDRGVCRLCRHSCAPTNPCTTN